MSRNTFTHQGGNIYSDLDATGKCEPDRHPRGPSRLFLLRIWQGGMPGKNDWQGMLQQTVTGESRYFASLAELRRILFELLSPCSAGQSENEARSEKD